MTSAIAKRSALVDTNLFLLLVVGTFDKNYIEKHKRTEIFTIEDYEILISNLSSFGSVWITSHCLAEVSNLLKQTNSNKQEGLLNALKIICGETKETHMSHLRVINDPHFFKLGIADTGIIQKSKRVTITFTIDHDLHIALLNKGREVINFNHLRHHLHI